MAYVGRFAPSPSGALHFGSLVAALASWLDARAAHGRWLLRIEDLDTPRVRRGATGSILCTLARLGLEWDGAVEHQSARTGRYRAALEALAQRGLAYPCGCTRTEMADAAPAVDGARIYPGTCRNGLAPGRQARTMRLRTSAEEIRFADRVQGELAQSVERAVGDFVLLRADGIYSYQLAVVVDDAAQGVTDVVRGADLIDSTARQILLQQALGYPEPRYLHLPVAVNAGGQKLSKQTGARAIDPRDAAGELARALEFLGQPPPQDMAARELLEWAASHWNVARIPKSRSIAPAQRS